MLKEKLAGYLTPQNIIAWFLGGVVMWFGLNEIFYTKDWVGFAPLFLGSGQLAYTAVFLHGVVLTVAGLMVFFNFYRRLGALVLVLIFAEIVVDLVLQQIATDIIVRDIGLWGMSWSLVVKSKKQS